jgi:hypothetical protein
MRIAPFTLLAVSSFALAACDEGFADTTWRTEDGATVMSLYEGGAAWEERYFDTTTGKRVVTDGLRFEGSYTEADDAVELALSCVSAQNARIATPCDTKVKREIACTLVEEEEAILTCKSGKTELTLRRDGVRFVE